MSYGAVQSILKSMRHHNRRTILMPAKLKVGKFDFECTAYDVSLGGIRLKVDLPIKQGAEVHVSLKDKMKKAANVVWSADGFIGLAFNDEPERIRKQLGPIAQGLN